VGVRSDSEPSSTVFLRLMQNRQNISKPSGFGNVLSAEVKQLTIVPSWMLERFQDSYTHRYNVCDFPFPCSEGGPCNVVRFCALPRR
jgi:hypothetical protein